MFEINGISWEVYKVPPNSPHLRRSDGVLTIGVTDWNDKAVYLSNILNGAFLRKVIAHELVHCFMFSYLIYIPIEEEEYIANWVATYGTDLITLLDKIMYSIFKSMAA